MKVPAAPIIEISSPVACACLFALKTEKPAWLSVLTQALDFERLLGGYLCLVLFLPGRP